MYSTKRGAVSVAAAMLIGLLAASEANAQTSDTETFTVNVASELSIAAPVASVAVTHDKTDTNQVFPVQAWAATQNNATGANVKFAVSTVFVNGTSKRDVKLDLAIASSDANAAWSVTKATDTTNYLLTPTADEAADVTANATKAGNATFNLTVTFVDTDYSILTTGAYSTTVTGTIAANP